MTSTDLSYYLARAAEHHANADSAQLPHVAEIHPDLAAKYQTPAEPVEIRQKQPLG